MINVDIRDYDGNLINQVKMMHTPTVGDTLWLQHQGECATYKTLEVCHWINVDQDYHQICVYVEEQKHETTRTDQTG